MPYIHEKMKFYNKAHKQLQSNNLQDLYILKKVI